MPDYSKGKIYKLVSNYTKKIYIGSTCQPLHQRKGGHKCHYKQYLSGKRHYQTSFDLFKFGDVDIVLIEECSVHNRDELHKRERYYIENYKCINKLIPGRTRQEYYEVNKDREKQKSKKHYEMNKDKVKKYYEEYYENNIDKAKQYYIVNKEKVKEYQKQYREKKKLANLNLSLNNS